MMKELLLELIKKRKQKQKELKHIDSILVDTVYQLIEENERLLKGGKENDKIK